MVLPSKVCERVSPSSSGSDDADRRRGGQQQFGLERPQRLEVTLRRGALGHVHCLILDDATAGPRGTLLAQGPELGLPPGRRYPRGAPRAPMVTTVIALELQETALFPLHLPTTLLRDLFLLL